MVRYLSEHKVQAGKVVLVAPWLDPDREYDTAKFFDFEIDPELCSRTTGLTIFNSDNDMDCIQKTVKLLREELEDHRYKEFHNHGHFCIGDMPAEFPELVAELLS